VDEARGFGPGDHLCWIFDTHDEFRSRAVEFLTDGLLAGERCWYMGAADVDTLTEDLRDIGPLNDLLRGDQLRVVSLAQAYGADPAAQVNGWAQAVQDALGAGHAGLRLVADCTALARTHALLDEFARYELLIDGYYAGGAPLTGMCAFHRPQLATETVGEIGCLHPLVNLPAAQPFRLHAATPQVPMGVAPAIATLAGEVDVVSVEWFARLLSRSGLFVEGADVVLDAADLLFIDHRGLIVLEELARKTSCTVVLRHGPYQATRIIEVLDIESVRVEWGPVR
jgi:hypothetical protein